MGSAQHRLNLTQMSCGDLVTSGRQGVTWEREEPSTAPPTVPPLPLLFSSPEAKMLWIDVFHKRPRRRQSARVCECVFECVLVQFAHIERWKSLGWTLKPLSKKRTLHWNGSTCWANSVPVKTQQDLLRPVWSPHLQPNSTPDGDHVTCCCPAALVEFFTVTTTEGESCLSKWQIKMSRRLAALPLLYFVFGCREIDNTLIQIIVIK